MAPPKKAAQSPNVPASTTVRVKVLRRGYYNHRLWDEDQTFDYTLPAGHTLPTWVRAVGGRPAKVQEEDTGDDVSPTSLSDDVI